MNEIFKNKIVRTGIAVVACIAAVYAMVYADVVLRARHAYLEGEKYHAWYENPQLKEQAFAAEFEKEKAALMRRKKKGALSTEEYDRQLELAQFSRDERLKESSIKYAYIWYQTAVELFSPPESKWVKLSREKMPQAKELWKQELRAKKIPFEDYMID